MANSLRKMNTVEEQSHANAAADKACRVLVDPCNAPKSPLAYFFSISIAQPKIRIKIPKALGKSIRKRSSDQCNDSTKNRGNAPEKLFAKKVGLIFSKVFSHKKREETCSSRAGKNSKAFGNGGKVGFGDVGSVESVSKGSERGGNGEGKQPKDVADVALPKMKNILVFQEGGKKKRLDNGEQLPSKSLFNRKKDRFSLCRGNSRRSLSSAKGVAATDFVSGKLERSPELARVPARILTSRQKLNRDRSMRKNLIGLFEEEGKREQRADEDLIFEKSLHHEVLCKKRILMGEKCRPLHQSGTLKYDKDGILLPENIP